MDWANWLRKVRKNVGLHRNHNSKELMRNVVPKRTGAKIRAKYNCMSQISDLYFKNK